MLRNFMVPIVLALAGVFVAATAAEAADNAVPAKSRSYRAARQLPPGLPRAGYSYRTTVAPATPYRDPVVVETDESLLITPAYGPGGYLANLPGTPSARPCRTQRRRGVRTHPRNTRRTRAESAPPQRA